MDENRLRCLLTPLLGPAARICCWLPPGPTAETALSRGQKTELDGVDLTKVRWWAGKGMPSFHSETVACGSETQLAAGLQLQLGA